MSAPDFDDVARRITPDQLARAVGAEREGRSWRCPLPDRHENGDEDPSFSIFEDGGRTAAKCHGCGLGGSPVSIYSQVTGAEPPEAAEELAREIGMHVPSENGGSREPEEVYTYRDLDGEPRFQVLRFPGKSFPQRRPDGSGGWTWGLDGVTKVLYRLPEVVEAAALGRTVYVVEGEKDADRLREEGRVATTPPGGAGGWRDHYADSLEGARVRVVMDRDEAGRKHARQVSESVRSGAESVEVLRPAVDEEGSDVSDHLDAGHELSDLEAVEHEPSDEPDPLGFDLPEAVPAADALEEEPPSFLVEGLLLENELGILIGEGGVYKTTIALAVAGAVATGEPLFDRFEVQESGPVLFVSEEDGGGVLRNRLEATARGHGWDVEATLRNVHLLALKGATLDDEEWRDHIAEEAERIGAVLVVLDPYSRLTRAAENSTDENKDNIAFMSRLNREGVTVSLVHHAGKDFEGKSKLDRVRGASAINQAARWIHFLERSDLGVAVECLKMSRAERPDRFVVEPDIETDPAEPTVWEAARFQYVTEDQAEEDAADEFVLDSLRRYPGTNSTGLKELAKGTGISAVEVSAAIRRLETVGKIEYEPGPRNAKEWHIVEET